MVKVITKGTTFEKFADINHVPVELIKDVKLFDFVFFHMLFFCVYG